MPKAKKTSLVESKVASKKSKASLADSSLVKTKKVKPVKVKPPKTKKASAKLDDDKTRERELKRLQKLTDQAPIVETVFTKTELRALKQRNRRPHGRRDLTNTAGNIIDVQNLGKTYVTGRTAYQALSTTSFTIARGDFVVILGASGSGKTTLLNLLSGLDRATEGTIVVNNLNIAALSSRELTTFRRNNIGFVFQSYNLLPELNARDNAELGRALQIDSARRGDISQLFEDIGLGEKMRASIAELSGGQQQRVAIARALAKRPHLIFADEPTGALDSVTAAKVLSLFGEINERLKTTIVIVTHDENIAKLATKVITVRDGKVQVGL